jgi:uncharacterized caspase-like protein
MSGKYALIIGNTEYSDPGLAQLSAPGKDAEDFARVLRDQEIGAFNEVNILLNQPEYVVREAIDDFFNQKVPDDLLVLYFSGHGVRDELGALYLAVKNTNRLKLKSTGIKSDYIREAMDQSRSKRQVLILDCCNSGAFAQGTKAAKGVSIGTASAFDGGYGRIILTASDSTQFAWEGDKVIGETDNSLFTHFLVEGLAGEADLDSDGRITVDELYDYAYEKVKLATPKQTPSKFSTKQQGEIVLRQITRIEDIKPVSLPDQLLSEIENPYPEVRLRAVEQLIKILNGKNLGLARSAREVLERIEKEDDSRRVVQTVVQILEPIRQQELDEKRRVEQIAKGIVRGTFRTASDALDSIREQENQKLSTLKAEDKHLAREMAEAERKTKEQAERLALAKAEQEAIGLANRKKSERAAKENVASKAIRPSRPLWMKFGAIGIIGAIIIAIGLCGYIGLKSLIGGPVATPRSTLSMPNIVRAHMANDGNDTSQTTVYTTDVPTFYCYFDLNNAPNTTVVKGTWTLISAEGYESNSKIDSAEITGGDNTYYFSLDRSGDSWPAGKYKIDLFINGKMVQTVEFEVR